FERQLDELAEQPPDQFTLDDVQNYLVCLRQLAFVFVVQLPFPIYSRFADHHILPLIVQASTLAPTSIIS
ncbi:hypothetical protein NE688_21220, partial [Eubacterium callanderi]